MTDSDERVMAPSCAAWLAAHPDWAPLPGAQYYEADHRGHGVRSIDRIVNGRKLRSVNLKYRLNNDGYPLVNVTDDDGNRVTRAVASCVMLAHAGPCPPGLEIRHLNNDPLDFRYCGCGDPGCTEGNMAYGTRIEQHADQVAAGTAVTPEFPCVNTRCDGKARNPGRRCSACAVLLGEFAALLLGAGMPSLEGAERFGLTSDRWFYGQAVKHGYTGTAAEARTQKPTLRQRVQILGILRMARRAGLLASDAA